LLYSVKMSKRPSPDTVIDLTLTDDEDQEFRLGEVRKVLNPRKAKTELNQEGSIDLTLIDDDVDQDLRLEHIRETLNPSKKVKTELNREESWQDRKPAAKEIQGRPLENDRKTASMITADVDEEIQILDDNEEGPFQLIAAASKTNSTDDDLEVLGIRNEVILPHNRCDCPKNKFSMSGCDAHQNEKHCDKCYCYVCDCLASECKSWNSNWMQHAHCNATDKINRWVQKRQEKKVNKEPRQYQAIKQNKCRKCGFEESPSGSDKCEYCGRVISESLMDKERSLDYKRIPKDVYLGERVIDFRIFAPDLRSMDKYKASWRMADKASPAWKYDESEIEEDIFRHRLGKRPRLQSRSSRPCIKFVSRNEKGRIEKNQQEAIIVENENDLSLLQFLRLATQIGMGNHKDHCTGRILADMSIRGNIEAAWDKANRKGTFKVQIFLPNTAFSTGVAFPLKEGFSLFLGLWFGFFPLVLADVCGDIKARNVEFTASEEERKLMKESVDYHNENVKAFRNQNSLTSSAGYSGMGGRCNNEQSLKGVLKSFFQDTYRDCKGFGRGFQWERFLNDDIPRWFRDSMSSCIQYLLSYRECIMIHHHIEEPHPVLDLSKVNTLMDHVENLGHEGFPYVEGLNIELLDFQKQSLQWCLEREKVKGGIQTFFWPKLPQADGISDLYYNPILQRLSGVPPQLVRGGFIADEMGLGKTIISLALILQNCAPLSPANGSPISLLSQNPSSEDSIVTWDKDLYARTSTDDPKRGSIISRATLVICPVSLVGQWIEEAKSKLKNPGLIYPYHGQNRIRDPLKLAKNAIVVTTYQVLASDNTHHRSKGGDGYCPPCETVRWWRVICDEGHHLRESNTKRNRAITNLVADHKWLVSGTPLNTSLKDLKNQLKFIGIQQVESYFSKIFSKPHGNKVKVNPYYLVFMLRSIMMRHTQKQMYRNSKTTLMSLPSKTERIIEIALSSKIEKELYDVLDKNAKDFYINFKRENESDISKHYLKLSQKLTPMRVACAGGPYPLVDDESDDNMAEEVEENRKKKKSVVYSSVAFKSKFKTLISELKRYRDEDASSKSLVFSQYASTLNWLKGELPNHDFQFRTLSGDMSMKDRAKALSDFQKDPPTTIFLLSMRAGNCGINLTQANRVFLMEPNFNPALEKQAIGRVHRLGQKREVEVIRLLIKDTVETRISKFLQIKYGAAPVAKTEDEVEPDQSNEMTNLTVPIGNVSTERPKNKILTKEFDILFGVETEETNALGSCMPDKAPSSGSI